MENEHPYESHSGKKSTTDKLRSNPWIISTFVLLILAVVLLVGSFGISGKTISEDKAADLVLGFVESQTGAAPDLVGVDKESGLYKVTILYQGSEVPLYVTQDGENLVQGVLPLSLLDDSSSSSQTSSTEVPKSDVPEVRLFIWSYCPYGVQAQVPFAEVASLLSDYADFKVVPYYDGHGAHETQENKIQSCIQQIAPDKYWDYAIAFVENIYPNCGSSRDATCDKTESVKLMDSLGIDSSAVLSCVDSQGKDFNDAAAELASQLGVTGSPTLVINGVKVNAARNSEAFKSAVCEAFNTPPEECGVALSDTSSASTTNSNVQC